MFKLRITVINPLGTFWGHLELKDEGSTEENVRDLSDGIQATINRLDRLVLVQHDGSEIAFSEPIIRQSVFIFKVEEVDE